MRIIQLLSLVWVTILLLPLPETAWAYIGPGSGFTVIGAALAFIGGIVLAIVGFVWYPIKRWMRNRVRIATADWREVL